MLKYHSTYIGFREIPDEISLCINISNCPNNCEGCHSPWLLKDKGTPLTYTELKKLVKLNQGVSCICFMGGDKEPWEINRLAKLIKEDINLKTAWYSGKELSDIINYTVGFDFIKVGAYKKKFGPLDNKNTNQILYTFNCKKCCLEDITYKFWKND